MDTLSQPTPGKARYDQRPEKQDMSTPEQARYGHLVPADVLDFCYDPLDGRGRGRVLCDPRLYPPYILRKAIVKNNPGCGVHNSYSTSWNLHCWRVFPLKSKKVTFAIPLRQPQGSIDHAYSTPIDCRLFDSHEIAKSQMFYFRVRTNAIAEGLGAIHACTGCETRQGSGIGAIKSGGLHNTRVAFLCGRDRVPYDPRQHISRGPSEERTASEEKKSAIQRWRHQNFLLWGFIGRKAPCSSLQP